MQWTYFVNYKNKVFGKYIDRSPDAAKNDPPRRGIADDKRLEAFLAIYRQQMEHYHKTQEVEWKVTFGGWALAASAVALTFRSDMKLGQGSWVWLVFLFPIAHAMWLSLIHESEEIDKELWVRFRNEALVLMDSAEIRYNPRTTWNKFRWLASEAGPTFVLAMIFVCRILAHF